MILTLFEAEDFKKEISKRFSVQIHFHDGCGGQYFTVDKPTDELKDCITDFFASKNIEAVFSENGEQFLIRKSS